MKLSGLLLAGALAMTSLTTTASAGMLSGAFLGKSAGRADAFTNDFIGDGQDRWSTFSSMNSSMYQGGLIGGKSEFRFRSELITPWGDGRQPRNADRIHAQVIGLGLFNEREIGNLNLKFGGEAIVTGDITGLAATQSFVHNVFGFGNGYNRAEDNPRELDTGLHGQGHFEASYDFNAGEYLLVRPFAGYKHGFETGATVGADVVLGNLSRANHWSRDPVSGFLIPAERAAADTLKFGNVAIIAGYDITSMSSSELFPEDGVSMTDSYTRTRLGAQIDIGIGQWFIGGSQIGEQFNGQYEPQTVGVISFDFVF